MISTKILVVITLLILATTSIVCLIVTFIKDNNEANESTNSMDCKNCKATKYCEEIPDMCCYNKKIIAEIIESEKKKEKAEVKCDGCIFQGQIVCERPRRRECNGKK